eukprot:TRINITY_DN33231_c0_g1_i1.p1 TRINITY_DN33231_c0_g1~~TRINITY_DN33231_c0_g1_i1.p1  ORF type:complete len:251 (+),score=121.31 TRINITY_DN33231_c0_g1_i1:54-755(+)
MPARTGYSADGKPAQPKAAEVAMELKDALNLKPLPTQPRKKDTTVTLWQGAARGDVARIREYLANNGPTNEKDAYKMTLLHHAVHGKQLEVTKMLLDAEADIDVQDAEGWSPLQYAVDKNCTELVELLVGRGADTSAKDAYKRSLLHNAARVGNAAIIEILREEGGCPAGAKTVVGFTALHYAAQEGHLDACKALKPTKVHLAAADASGKNAAQLAADAGHAAVAEYLQSLVA